MKIKRRYSYPLLAIVIFWYSAFMTMASDISTIKVGLESVYTNVDSISLSSDTNIEVGYYDNFGFSPIGVLNTSSITISKVNRSYYDIGGFYMNYQEAEAMAQATMGIPACVDPGIFVVYTDVPTENSIETYAASYVVKDHSGKEIFVFSQSTNPIVFRGYDTASGLNLTQVGTSKKYRGAIGIGGTTGITPYNILSIEEYLYGVVPCEMSASWPEEALKAQAVAARSIAIYQYNRFVSSGYNVVDTTTTQAYGGYNREDSRTTSAVDATRGQTIKYNGKVAEALYFSTSGGYTESAENVWGNPIPYLIGIEDAYETEPAQGEWTRTISLAEINNCLANKGISIGSAQGVQIISRTASGRVKEMLILGTVGSYRLTLENVRTFFSKSNEGSLKSRLFSLGSGNIGGNMGGGNYATDTVTVVSATGVNEISLGTASATNGQVTEPITGDIATVQSATSSVQMTLSNNGSSGSIVGDTAYGDVTIVGKGYGHGVGMSQSGAKGMAKAGFSYIDILKHYYNGITVE